MEVNEEYCYTASKDFSVKGIAFKAGDQIITYSVNSERVFFCKKESTEDYSELPERELAQYLNLSTGSEYFGTCEHCGRELSCVPDAGLGVGYVCGSCAQELRGELEY